MVPIYGTIYYIGKHANYARIIQLLQRLLHKPVSANISWHDIENLILSYGAKREEGSGSRVTFILNGVVATFHRPHGSEKTDRGAMKSIIKFSQKKIFQNYLF